MDSPVSLLASYLSQKDPSPSLILITGESGAGKTRWCQELVRQEQLSGLSTVGLISPAVFEAGVKTGIDVLAIHSGERRRLAVPAGTAERGSAENPRSLYWKFDPQVLEWADRVLSELAGGEVLVLDELGPLEFFEGTGFMSGMRWIDDRRYRLSVVVIRPSLLSRAQARWPWGRALDVSGLDGAEGMPG